MITKFATALTFGLAVSHGLYLGAAILLIAYAAYTIDQLEKERDRAP